MRLRSNAGPATVNRLCLSVAEAGTVYLVHPGALPAAVHRTLAAALPVGTGLTVLDLSGVPEYWEAAFTGGRAETTVEALAERLLAELVQSHDGGRYSLAGWSFGGVLAHAMAEQLPCSVRPGQVILLDSIAPVRAYKQPDEALRPSLLLGWFTMYLGARRGRPIVLDPDRLAEVTVEDGLSAVLSAAIAAGALPADTPMPGLRKLYDTYVDGLLRNNRLVAPYLPNPSRVPLTLVTAERGLLPGDPMLGWQLLAARGLSLYQVPGDHYTMLTRPDAAALIAPLVIPN